MKRSVLSIFLLALTVHSFSQNFSLQVNQPDFLRVDAGRDTLILSGGSATIGGSPSALYGYGNYLFNWEPADGLNDPALANPTAAPDHTTTYLLSVTDGGNCIGQDEVTITVNSSAIHPGELDRQVRTYPNPAVNELFVSIDGIIDDAELRLSDAYGNVILMRTIPVTHEWKGSIPLANLSSGYYFLWITQSDRRIVLPVIILK